MAIQTTLGSKLFVAMQHGTEHIYCIDVASISIITNLVFMLEISWQQEAWNWDCLDFCNLVANSLLL